MRLPDDMFFIRLLPESTFNMPGDCARSDPWRRRRGFCRICGALSRESVGGPSVGMNDYDRPTCCGEGKDDAAPEQKASATPLPGAAGSCAFRRSGIAAHSFDFCQAIRLRTPMIRGVSSEAGEPGAAGVG